LRLTGVGAALALDGRPPAESRRRVPLFDLARQDQRLGPRLTERIFRILEHGRFILGPEVEELEAALARYAGVRHAIGVSSGRDALIMALMALGVGRGDAVFVPALTFSATAGAVVAVGAAPVFVDVDPITFNLAPEALASALARTRRRGGLRPRAVIPVDLYGLPADYEALRAVADAAGLVIIADAAQSFGARARDGRVGNLAPITATSFYPTKPLGAFGDGGAVLTDDDGLDEAVREIRNHGTRGTGDVAVRLGMTGRLDTLQAGVLLTCLEAFDGKLASVRRLASLYCRALEGAVQLPVEPAGSVSAWALFTIRLPDRDRVRARLAEAGIDTGLYYRVPLNRHPAFAEYLTGEEDLPVAERLAGEVLSLPLHAALTDDDVAYVAETLLAC
jgi:UDP-2-acetamido-2-deoxy-ribo-hexuluronate aminotransferase